MPGRMLLVDTKLGSVIKDEELKYKMSTLRPVDQWLKEHLLRIDDFYRAYIKKYGQSPDIISCERESQNMGGRSVETDRRMPIFGYSVEDVHMLVAPMVRNG